MFPAMQVAVSSLCTTLPFAGRCVQCDDSQGDDTINAPQKDPIALSGNDINEV